MSSDDDLRDIDGNTTDHLTGPSNMPKRRRLLRGSCDTCRKKKIRCYSQPDPSVSKCSYCSVKNLDCTFLEPSPRRSPPKAYITALEKRVDLLEKLIRRVAPTVDIDKEVGPSFNADTWVTVKGTRPASAMSRLASRQAITTSSTLHVLPHATQPAVLGQILSAPSSSATMQDEHSSTIRDNPENSDNEKPFAGRDGSVSKHLEATMQKLRLDDDTEKRFHGKSAGVNLVQAALALKADVTGIPSTWDRCHIMTNARPKFSQPSPWELVSFPLPAIDSFGFPPPDLIWVLVNHFFDEVIPLAPLLHRRMFEQQYKRNDHRHDHDFARLLLLVCSVGSRYCNDARVCLTSAMGEPEWNSAGWMYFAQVYQITKPIIASSKLVDLQIMALMAMYLQGTSSSKGAWLINGVGLRLAEDTGAHREKVYAGSRTFQNQLWKRTFWYLLVTDRAMSAILGRPMCITDEDIDAHLPLEVDDEGWDEANQTWTQPDGKPSLLAYLTNYARLMGILTRAMRTIYSISKSKARFGMVGPDWEQNTVAELDSALNEWLDAVPDHLRWDPHMDSKSVFYRQAAALRLNFYYVQITIHRPFVQLSSSSKRALSLPSLAICTNAARSSARILSATMDMTAPTMFPMISFISGLILLISIWEARRSGLHVDISQQIVDVQTCLMYLKKWEHRYYLCGRLYDILRETAFVSDVAVPTSQQHIPPSSTDASDGNGTAWDGRDPATGQSDQPQSASDHVQRSFNPHSITVSANGSLLGPTSISSSSTPSSPGPSQSNQYPLAVFDANDTSLATNAFINQPGTLGSISILNNNDSLAALNSTWENYHLAGLDMGFQGFPGYNVQAVNGTIDSMAPDTFWYELLGPLVGGGEDTELYH